MVDKYQVPYDFYQTYVTYSGQLTYQPAPEPADESKWTDMQLLSRGTGPGYVWHKDGSNGKRSQHIGHIANLELYCDPALSGKGEISLVPYSTSNPNGTAFGQWLPFPLEFILWVPAAPASLGIDCLSLEGDKDLDGCTDEAEGQAKAEASAGGGRDPNYFWDVYDVNHDGHIDLFIDIFGVANRFGAASVPPLTKQEALAEALSVEAPPDPPAYHAAFDRSAQNGPNVWNIGPPDGSIDLFIDIFGVANQFGHDCTAAP